MTYIYIYMFAVISLCRGKDASDEAKSSEATSVKVSNTYVDPSQAYKSSRTTTTAKL